MRGKELIAIGFVCLTVALIVVALAFSHLYGKHLGEHTQIEEAQVRAEAHWANEQAWWKSETDEENHRLEHKVEVLELSLQKSHG